MDTSMDSVQDTTISPTDLRLIERFTRDLRADIATQDARHAMRTTALGFALGIVCAIGSLIAMRLGFLEPSTPQFMFAVVLIALGACCSGASGWFLAIGFAQRHVLRRYEQRLAEIRRARGSS